MNVPHAAAFALVGWSLMIPPVFSPIGEHDRSFNDQKVGREGAYEVLYGEWSILGHGQDALLRHLVEGQAGGPAVRPIRNPESISQTVRHAVNFALEATRLMIEKYRPAELMRYSEWLRKGNSNAMVCRRWSCRAGIPGYSLSIITN